MFKRALKKSFFFQWITLWSIIAEPTEPWLHHNTWCKY